MTTDPKASEPAPPAPSGQSAPLPPEARLSALSIFHPIVRDWFAEKVGVPTDVQARAWPVIAAGRHVLLTAPTGSGKTLTAFLGALDSFLAGRLLPGATRVLYVSPLKALNNDIQRNLLGPLEALRSRAADAGLDFPEVRVQVRSGDTPGSERRRMLRHPPEILITTPESLNLLLLSAAGREALRGVATVLLDEIHAVAGTKRGVHLITAVDRLVPLCGEFQRVALSATVKPLPLVAEWVGGFRREGEAYLARPVDLVVSRAPKVYELTVRYPVEGEAKRGSDVTAVHGREEGGRLGPPQGASPGASPESGEASAETAEEEKGIWESMALAIKGLVGNARSTLVFANNRRLSERLARLLNEGEERPLAYAHHGSLSREIRAVVEARMKEGRLPAIVATSSLELGIDVGALDQVILVETPITVAAALQRLGRACHGVGQVSRGHLFASHGRDLLDACVAVECLAEADIEAVHPVENPLDLLSQILVAMTANQERGLESLYAEVKASWPFRALPRRSFDLVIEMLAGRYADTRIRELKPRVAVDAVDRCVRGLPGAPLLVGLSGGTIPDRGYYTLRHAQSRARIGELDEEFVWERREGELFALGSQSWRIVNITPNDVEVVPADRSALLAPFWRAEDRDRDAHFSLRLAEFLERADARLEDPAFLRELEAERRLDPFAARSLVGYLRRQRAATGTSLPHRRHLLVEDCGDAPGKGGRQVVLHAVWGGRLTRPWGHALAAAWEERGGLPLEIVQDDDCLLVRLPQGEPAHALLDLVHPGNLEDLLRRRLERTGFFAARFRENAARALLLPRATPGTRTPLWLNRLRAKRLLDAISGFGDFPIVLETWRECLRDEFDLGSLKARLDEVQSGAIRVREAKTARPSPFAEGLLWKQTNQLVYEKDRPADARGIRGARPDLLKEIAFSAPLRPRIPRAVVAGFEAKAQRTAPGYAPQGARDLVEWAKERLLIPWPEWERLAPLCEPAPGGGEEAGRLEARLVALVLPGAAAPALAAVESLPRILAALGLGISQVTLGAPLDPAAPWRAAPAEPLAPPSPAARAALETLPGTEAGAAGPADEEAAGAPADAPERTAALAVQWLRAYGPVRPEVLQGVFGAAFPRVEEALRALAEEEKVVVDALTEDAGSEEVCEAANLETLLRLMRRRARPAVRALPAGALPLFLATWHGLAAPGKDAQGLEAALERLFGWPAPAAAWEADILPARLLPYQAAWLDGLFSASDLIWFGAGKERLAFGFPEDLELFLPGAGAAGEPGASVEDGIPNESGADSPLGRTAGKAASPARREALEALRRASPARLDFQALAARSPRPSDDLTAALWELAWEGRITNDTFAAVRRGVETGFKLKMPEAPSPAAGARGGFSRRGHFQRWKAARPLAGAWLALPDAREPDPLEREELAKDRARQLLRRHGVLFRELLQHELPALQWAQVFRSLRLMELSGEVLSGQFFEGVPGVQFLSPAALPLLEDGLPAEAVYWMSAQDPASPCGLGLAGLPYALPPRVPGTHLVFHGAEPALVSRRQGREIVLRVPPRHPYLASYLGALRHLVERAFLPLKAVEVETVNGVGALGSPYLEDFLDAGFEKGLKTLSLRRRFG